jgi:hypothetical protein
MRLAGFPGFPVGAATVVLAVCVAACSPVEGGSLDVADVEKHLDLVIGFLPEGCEPVGLGGDGRGRMVDAALYCPDAATLRIERLESESNGQELPTSPSESSPGRVEWRDESTGDVVRIASSDLEVDLLMRVAESIEVRG